MIDKKGEYVLSTPKNAGSSYMSKEIIEKNELNIMTQ